MKIYKKFVLLKMNIINFIKNYTIKSDLSIFYKIIYFYIIVYLILIKEYKTIYYKIKLYFTKFIK